MTVTPEIPEEAVDAALEIAMDDGHNGIDCRPERHLGDTMRAALAAAFPHLQPSEAESKALAATTFELGRALGRKEAAGEIAAMVDDLSEGVANPGKPYNEAFIHACGVIRRHILGMLSQPSQAVSEPLTAPSGHTDLPEASECPGCGQEGTGLESHRADCPRLPDLPEGREHP